MPQDAKRRGSQAPPSSRRGRRVHGAFRIERPDRLLSKWGAYLPLPLKLLVTVLAIGLFWLVMWFFGSFVGPVFLFVPALYFVWNTGSRITEGEARWGLTLATVGAYFLVAKLFATGILFAIAIAILIAVWGPALWERRGGGGVGEVFSLEGGFRFHPRGVPPREARRRRRAYVLAVGILLSSLPVASARPDACGDGGCGGGTVTAAVKNLLGAIDKGYCIGVVADTSPTPSAYRYNAQSCTDWARSVQPQAEETLLVPKWGGVVPETFVAVTPPAPPQLAPGPTSCLIGAFLCKQGERLFFLDHNERRTDPHTVTAATTPAERFVDFVRGTVPQTGPQLGRTVKDPKDFYDTLTIAQPPGGPLIATGKQVTAAIKAFTLKFERATPYADRVELRFTANRGIGQGSSAVFYSACEPAGTSVQGSVSGTDVVTYVYTIQCRGTIRYEAYAPGASGGSDRSTGSFDVPSHPPSLAATVVPDEVELPPQGGPVRVTLEFSISTPDGAGDEGVRENVRAIILSGDADGEIPVTGSTVTHSFEETLDAGTYHITAVAESYYGAQSDPAEVSFTVKEAREFTLPLRVMQVPRTTDVQLVADLECTTRDAWVSLDVHWGRDTTGRVFGLTDGSPPKRCATEPTPTTFVRHAYPAAGTYYITVVAHLLDEDGHTLVSKLIKDGSRDYLTVQVVSPDKTPPSGAEVGQGGGGTSEDTLPPESPAIGDEDPSGGGDDGNDETPDELTPPAGSPPASDGLDNVTADAKNAATEGAGAAQGMFWSLTHGTMGKLLLAGLVGVAVLGAGWFARQRGLLTWMKLYPSVKTPFADPDQRGLLSRIFRRNRAPPAPPGPTITFTVPEDSDAAPTFDDRLDAPEDFPDDRGPSTRGGFGGGFRRAGRGRKRRK